MVKTLNKIALVVQILDDSFDFGFFNVCTLNTDWIKAGTTKQHISVANKVFRPVKIKNREGIYSRTSAESNSCRKIGFYCSRNNAE